MEISFEKIDALNAEVTISVIPSDYAEVVEKGLKALKHKVNVPGFRPGMVPVGMMKKLYGKAILSDEIGKITTDKLFKYLEDEKIIYLGEPLPSLSKNKPIDWDQQTNFVFYYDLGLSPVFDVTLPTDVFTSYQIEVDTNILEKEINKLRDRNGRNINPDVAEDGDFVMADATELNAPNETKVGGIKKTIYVFTAKIDDADLKSKIIGSKIGDKIQLNAKKLYKDDITATIYLGVKAEEVETISNLFDLEITTINRMVPAEMNVEFYDKVFGEGIVTTEEEFTERISGFLKNDLQAASNNNLLEAIRTSVVENNQFELPDEFLKRWLKIRNENNKNVDVDELINDFENNKSHIRWEIIRNKLIEKYQLNIEEGELMDAAKADVMTRASQMGYQIPEEKINEFAKTLLSNQDEAQRLINRILEYKALRKIKEDVNIAESTIGYEEYGSLLEKEKELINQ